MVKKEENADSMNVLRGSYTIIGTGRGPSWICSVGYVDMFGLEAKWERTLSIKDWNCHLGQVMQRK